MVGGGGRADEDTRVEGRQQAEFLAGLLLAAVRRAVTGEVGVLAGEAGRRGLAAGIGVAAGVEDERLDRGAAGQYPRHRAEADVEGGAVATDREHGRNQCPLLGGEVAPRQGAQRRVVLGGLVAAGQLELRHPHGANLVDQPGDQAFVDADRQGLGVLEQAVDPRVEVGRERHGRGVHARAAGRVGDHRRGGAVAGRARLVEVDPVLQLGDGAGDPLRPRAAGGHRCQQAVEPLHGGVELAQVRRQPAGAEVVRQRGQQVDGRHLTAAAAGAVAAGHRVVAVPAEQDPLDVAGRVGGSGDQAGRGVGQLGEPLETGFQHAQQDVVLVGRGERVRPADLDALQAAGALPGVDDRGEQRAGTRCLLLHRVEQRTGARHREGCDLADHVLEVLGEDPLRRQGGHRGLDDSGEVLCRGLGDQQPADFAGPVGHQLTQPGPGGLRQVGGVDRDVQQVADLVAGVGDRVVGAGEGALHARGAGGGVEDRHGAAEQALVLDRRGADGHEHAGSGQHGGLVDGALAERPRHDLVVVAGVEQAGGPGLGHGRGHQLRQRRPGRDRGPAGFGLGELGGRVVDQHSLHAVADHGHVGLDHGLALATELLGELGLDPCLHLLRGGTLGDPVDVADDRPDEGHAHHPGLQLGVRGVGAGHREGVQHQQPDAALADRAAGVRGQFGPHVERLPAGLQDQGAAGDQALQRVGVGEHLVVGRHHDLDVLQLGVGDEHRLGRQGDVVVGRCAGLLRPVLRGRLGVHPEHPGEDVGQQLAGGDGAVAADRVEPDPQRLRREHRRVRAGLQRHQLGLGVGGAHPVLDRGDRGGGVLDEELRAEVHQRRAALGGHVLEGGHQVPRLHVVAAEAEDGSGEAREQARVVERLGDQPGQGGVVGALEHGDGLGVADGGDQLLLGERLQQLDRDDADLETLRAQVGKDGAHVVGDRAHAHHHVVGVGGVVRLDGGVAAAGQLGVLRHRLAYQCRDGGGEVGAVVGGAGLEIGLILDRAGQAGVVRVDQGGDELTGALGPRAAPLPAPLGTQRLGHPGEGAVDQVAGVVGLDLLSHHGELGTQRLQVGGLELGGMALQVGGQLEDASLGAEEQILGHGRARDAAGRVAEVGAQQLRLGQGHLAHHVAGGEAVHGVGDRNERQGGRAVGDRREVGSLLRVGAEQDGVAGGEHRVDVVVAGHDVEGVLGHDPCGDVQHEAADLLADGDVVRLEAVEDALARGGVGDEVAAGERRAEGAALGGVLTLGLDEEGVPAPHVELTFGPCSLEQLGDLGGGRDRVADDPAAHVLHHVGDGAVAVDDFADAGEPGRGCHDSSCQAACSPHTSDVSGLYAILPPSGDERASSN